MNDLIVHASRCRCSSCAYPNCRKVKGLTRHMKVCKTRANGGCILCWKGWDLLLLHSRTCDSTTECYVPRCKDLKDHERMLQQRSNSVSTEPSASAQPGNSLDQSPQEKMELLVQELEYLNLREEMEESDCL
ncbi:histone acetyltransferase [Ranunculus cassubicifolius]